MEIDSDRYKARPAVCRGQGCPGFTLIELIMVLSIVAVIAVLALPSYKQFLDREKMEALATEFAQTVVSARSSAVRAGIPVVMCASSNGSACTDDWVDGWLTFIDQDRDGDMDTNEALVNRYLGQTGIEEMLVVNEEGDEVDAVRFNYRGVPDSTLTVTVTISEQSDSLSVNAFGKPRFDD